MDHEYIEQIEPIGSVRRPEVWHWLLSWGIITMFLGLAAILLPFSATLAVETIIAAVLVFAGLVQIIHAFHSRQAKGFFLRLFAGLLYFFVGGVLLAYPSQGILSLTLLLIILFILSAGSKIALAVLIKPLPSWGWLLFSGIVSALLAFLIWIGLPGTAGWVIGLFVGIELIMGGWTMTMFALSLR